MEQWQEAVKESIVDVERLAARFSVDPEPLRTVAATYPLRITPHYLSLIEQAGDPIWRQCIPDVQELADDGLLADPLDEENLSPVPGLIHRYPDRVVLLASLNCAVYCRFCMRKRRVGLDVECARSVDEAITYIAECGRIRDVLISGGDPLLLDDERLEQILARLHGIPHVEMIRIGTRVPVTLPERITEGLCRMLKRYHPVYINTHFNHPLEITPVSAKACAMLVDAGVPLGNQTVLLRGVNDDCQTMVRLMRRLLEIRVRPYYLHQMDLVRGTGHFRTSVRRGLQIMESMRGHISGLAIPHYVIDLPGGKGKVPLLPGQVDMRGNLLQLRTYRGEVVTYSDLSDQEL
ncbi:KamA family radical SAM protein [Geobacter sp. DSM 9736]|uniref:KamA family radical SAM protein n=1 Tax=Geobacter sp. DSM 9736 TaxID=1277350 RepID=UPI000B4FDA98|nr:KamA family radical SAM protein [Geobacter sp. DSM 9736]SNB45604.1 L-lysine 2,3-aminomutase [Geobacter sp. DSM 9736]